MKKIIWSMCRQCPIRMAAIIIVSLGIGCFVPLTTFAESSLIDSVVDLFQKNTLGNLEGIGPMSRFSTS